MNDRRSDPRTGLTVGIAPTGWDANTRKVLGLLLVIQSVNFLDRQILTMMAEPIARELSLSDTQIGLLTGLAFAVCYSLMLMPLARIVDNLKTNRVVLISACLVLWSGMTAASGFAQNFAQLLLARVGVSIGEAGSTPGGTSLIADIVPGPKRASAMAVFMTGGPIGSLIGLVLGGFLVDVIGWRVAFMVVGLPGLSLAVALLALVRDPRSPFPARRAQEKAGAAGRIKLRDSLQTVFSSKAFVRMLAAGSGQAILGYGQGVWTVIFFMRSLNLSASQAGLAIGLTFGLSGIVGSILGGAVADRLGAKDRKTYFAAPVIGLTLGVPLLLLAYTSNIWWFALLMLIVPYVGQACAFGPDHAAVQSLFGPRTRGVAVAVRLLVQTVIGAGLGPLVMGALSDALKPTFGAESVRYVLIGSAFISLIPAAFFWLASRHLPREMIYYDRPHEAR